MDEATRTIKVGRIRTFLVSISKIHRLLGIKKKKSKLQNSTISYKEHVKKLKFKGFSYLI